MIGDLGKLLLERYWGVHSCGLLSVYRKIRMRWIQTLEKDNIEYIYIHALFVGIIAVELEELYKIHQHKQ